MGTKDTALQLQRASEEIAHAFGQLATEPGAGTVDDWEHACEALRELLNVATSKLVEAAQARLLATELEPEQSAAQ